MCNVLFRFINLTNRSAKAVKKNFGPGSKKFARPIKIGKKNFSLRKGINSLKKPSSSSRAGKTVDIKEMIVVTFSVLLLRKKLISSSRCTCLLAYFTTSYVTDGVHA